MSVPVTSMFDLILADASLIINFGMEGSIKKLYDQLHAVLISIMMKMVGLCKYSYISWYMCITHESIMQCIY